METVDAYMEIIPAGSKSGKHRHLAEECVYVLEGRGYDMHQDCDVEITDTYHWKPQDEVKRYEWGGGRRDLTSRPTRFTSISTHRRTSRCGSSRAPTASTRLAA